jgi:hypothetical protein
MNQNGNQKAQILHLIAEDNAVIRSLNSINK